MGAGRQCQEQCQGSPTWKTMRKEELRGVIQELARNHQYLELSLNCTSSVHFNLETNVQ